MILNDISMVVADTSRSRMYLQSLIKHNLIPNSALLLENKENDTMAGQIKETDFKESNFEYILPDDDCWSEAKNNLFEPVESMLNRLKINYKKLGVKSINNEYAIKAISERKESIFIYSGFGGTILKKKVFDTGKHFLHVHGGYLPYYRGSTTNYYSLINENKMGATAIFLNEKIDGGPIIKRSLFPAPLNKEKIDHLFDNAARSKVLIEAPMDYISNGNNFLTINSQSKGEIFYIIHPVLKHIAITRNNYENNI